MAEIRDIAQRGTLGTNLMFKANLSFVQLNQYVSLLSQTGLLEKSAFNGEEIYKAAQKGLESMEKQQKIINLLNEDTRKVILKTSFEVNRFPEKPSPIN